MSDKMFKKSWCAGRRWLATLGFAAGLALFGAGNAMAQQTTLFTTQEDFTGWTNGGGSPVVSWAPSSAWDYDGSSTDGLVNGNAAGTPGSLEVNTGSNAIGYIYTVFSSPNFLYNTAVMQQVDPGFTTPGDTVASSNTAYITYTAPQWVGPDVYYQVGLDLSYAGSGYYAPFFPTSVIDDGIVDGMQTYTSVIPYTISANSSGGGFSLSPFFNAGTYGSGVSGTSNVLTAPIYFDDIAVNTVAVPEPASMSLIAATVSMLAIRRRRRA